MFAEYLKALPELYIDEKYKLEAELIEKQQQIEELESKDNKIKALEKDVNLLMNVINKDDELIKKAREEEIFNELEEESRIIKRVLKSRELERAIERSK